LEADLFKMSKLSALLSRWRADPTIGGNIVAWETIPAQAAVYKPFPKHILPQLKKALEENDIEQLFSHQAEAVAALHQRQHVAIVTSTASGKTIAYNLPIVNTLLQNPEARALYLFPTKALAHDQLSGLNSILSAPALKNLRKLSHFSPLSPATYDGDTSSSQRMAIRNRSRVIFSNPDMLHAGILPHHTRWQAFFKSLQFVVIDEMHTYRGVFGSHVANIIRRLKRVADFYGQKPQFILTSATIGNPTELAQALIEAPVTTITSDGAARGPKQFLVYNPPVIDPDLGLRAGLLPETQRLVSDLLTANIQTIVFGRTRQTVELLRRNLSQMELAWVARIQAYRSGYLPSQRRDIEAGLRSGSILAVFTTTALELGIDIGQLQAAVLAGYPGTVAGSWQQAGRSGRGTDPSLAILVTSASPLDQFLAKFPEYFFGQTPEYARINPNNLLILLHQLQCAAFELPFSTGDSFGDLGPSETTEFLDYLRDTGTLHKSGPKYFWMQDQYPAAGVSLRSASPQRFSLQLSSGAQAMSLGEVDGESVNWMVHPGAIYLHQGETYFVEDLDHDRQTVNLTPITADYYTRPRQESEVVPVEISEEAPIPGGVITHGEIKVTSQVVGFEKIRWGSNEKIGIQELELPISELHTTGYWLTVSPETVAQLKEVGLWTNDPNDYGPQWSQQRILARERDNFTCQVCGILEGPKAHHVHHIAPFRAFQSAAAANYLDNLVTLCPTCHQRVESSVRIRSGLAGLSHIMGHLAPLFLMCDRRDLGVHHDPQSPLSEGQPTIIIFDRVPGGIGFSKRLFEVHAELVQRAYDLALACECKDGCPACVGPGGEDGSGSKRETVGMLSRLIEADQTVE
jgi:DEAD/DEAH box helicase domain-containing protein